MPAHSCDSLEKTDHSKHACTLPFTFPLGECCCTRWVTKSWNRYEICSHTLQCEVYVSLYTIYMMCQLVHTSLMCASWAHFLPKTLCRRSVPNRWLLLSPPAPGSVFLVESWELVQSRTQLSRGREGKNTHRWLNIHLHAHIYVCVSIYIYICIYNTRRCIYR